MVLQKFQIKLEVYETKLYDQQFKGNAQVK